MGLAALCCPFFAPFPYIQLIRRIALEHCFSHLNEAGVLLGPRQISHQQQGVGRKSAAVLAAPISSLPLAGFGARTLSGGPPHIRQCPHRQINKVSAKLNNTVIAQLRRSFPAAFRFVSGENSLQEFEIPQANDTGPIALLLQHAVVSSRVSTICHTHI